MILRSLIPLNIFINTAWAGCPFQNPFFFIDRPSVLTVVDSDGKMVPDRVRVSWGQVENFKCVDYFQIEYYEATDPEGTAKLTGKIERHRKSHDIDIKPCSEFLFKVIASEDWKGMREDFRMASDTISFRVDYTPKFKRPPIVKERRIRIRKPPNRGRRRRVPGPLFEDVGKSPTPPPPTEPAIPYNVWVSWHLSYIDWPMCLKSFEFDYFDTVYNESAYKKVFEGPFDTPRMEFEDVNTKMPCSDHFSFVVRVYGLTGAHSSDHWTPPSCTSTTPVPTTTTTTAPTTKADEGAFDRAVEKNQQLKEKLSGLKQAYGPIGKQVYESLKDGVYKSFEGFLARKQVMEGGDIGDLQELAANSDDPFYALKYLI